jgi:intracellular sulfur oxidation DsrE/DsrF family protein
MRRSSFLLSSSALAMGASATAAAAAVPGGTSLVERRSSFDEAAFARIVGRPAQIRQLVESVTYNPVTLNNVKNTLNGLQFGYGYPASEIAVVMANHGAATAWGLSTPMWRKYRLGEFYKIDDKNGTPLTANLAYPAKASYDVHASPDDEHGMYQDASIEMLQRRGVVVLACHTAIEEQSRKLVAGGFAPGMTAQEVAGDLLTHLIPHAVVVPSMVATIAVLQARFRYTYLTLAF